MLDPWTRKSPWRKEWLPTPRFLLGEFYGQRSLAGYCPWGLKESDKTEQLTPSLSFMVILFLIFWGMDISFSTAVVQSFIPIHMHMLVSFSSLWDLQSAQWLDPLDILGISVLILSLQYSHINLGRLPNCVLIASEISNIMEVGSFTVVSLRPGITRCTARKQM